MHDLSITLFGAPQIKRGNEQISIQRRKDLALLIYLACTPQPQSRDTLATLLWQDQTQADARSNLRKSLSRLKSTLGEDVFFISQDQVGINPKRSIRLDTTEFTSRINMFRQHAHVKKGDAPHLCGDCQTSLEEAARIYCADFLQGFSIPDSPSFDEWQFFQGEGLRKDLAEILEHLTLHYTFAMNYAAAIEHCRRWLSLDRLHEPAHRQLMFLYALNGQQAAALRQFEECSQLLRAELGIEPEAETRQLYESIQKKKIQDAPQTWRNADLHSTESIPAVDLTPSPHAHLPSHFGPLIGREKELDKIFRILNEPACRLLTLLGPGGSGKTRLALETASRMQTGSQAPFTDGVGFISLAPARDLVSLLNAMLEGLKLTGYLRGADARQTLLAHLHGRRMLLVIDNLEHLLSTESVQLMTDILDAAPSSKILITSRERLNVRGEYVFRVEGLETPGDESLLSMPPADSAIETFGALRLFEQCARRTNPSFNITPQNYFPIAEICRTVQGMPLAIELAASWLEVFSAEEINEEIKRSLDFLESNWRDVPDRQRSLRAVFDSSWQLLERQARPIIRALSVFRTSFTREAARAISGASVKTILELTNKSWLQKLSNGRYQIHELLKQFVYEKLSADKAALAQVRGRFCDYYADYANAVWAAMKGPDQRQAFAGIEMEFENIRTAWMWLISRNQPEVVIRGMLPILLHYTEIRGKTLELLGMLDAAIKSLDAASNDENQDTVAIILHTARGTFFEDGYPLRYSIHDAIFPTTVENIRQTWQHAKQSVALHELGFWGILLTYDYGRLINLKESVTQLEQMIQHFRGQNQLWELATAYLHLLRLMIPNSENADEGQALTSYLTEAMRIFDKLGDRISAGHILSLWGQLRYVQHDLEGAIDDWNRARAIFLSVGEWGTATSVLWPLIDANLQLGNFSKAYEGCREMANIYRQHGLREFVVGALSKESYEKARHGDLAEALEIRQQCIDMIHEIGPEYQFAWNYWEMGELVRLSGDLVGAADWFERAHQIFEKNQDSIGKSFYYRGMGEIALTRGEFEAAHAHFAESIRLARAANHTWLIACALNGISRSELGLQDHSSAREHLVEALNLAIKARDLGLILVILTAYATWLGTQRKYESAVQLASLVQGHPVTWHETKNQAANLLAELKKSLSRRDFLKAEKEGKQADVWRIAGEHATQK